MRQKSLQAKLQQSVSLVIVITLLASYMMAIFLVYNQTSASMREEIEKEADYLAAAVSITGEEHLEDLDTAFPDTRITLIDREGTVIYDTDQYEITFVNHLDRPEVVSAAGKGRGSDVRRSDSLGEEMYYYAILLEDGNILRISRAADTALRTAVHILPIVLIIGAGLMLIGLLLTRRRLISLIDPINRIDLNEPMENDIYIELTPLLVRIDQQNKEKEELAQIRQEFSANVSHELRTPLTSISGYAEIIKNGIVRDRDIPAFADRIYREAQRMIALIEDIMRLSKLDEGALVQKEQVDLYAVADEVRGRLEHAAADRNIRLSLQGVHCRMRGFRQILDEMIYNLVDNAIKYNKERGSVLIQVNPQEDGILLSVRDTGIGIPDDARDRVFERFYRVDKSHSRQTGGTGLGLSITKSAILRHHGTVTVERKEGEGTTFTVQIPLRYSAEPIELRPGRPRRQLSRLLRFRGHADRQKDYEEKTILVSRRKVNPEEAHYSQKTLYPDKQDPQKKTPGPEDRTDGSGHSSAYTSGVKADGTERRDTNA